jgi:hypothetical protein
LWVAQGCGAIVGVAVPLERFYKPEPDAVHNPQLQAITPASVTVF